MVAKDKELLEAKEEAAKCQATYDAAKPANARPFSSPVGAPKGSYSWGRKGAKSPVKLRKFEEHAKSSPGELS